MKKSVLLLLILSFTQVFSQVTYQKTFGGPNFELFWSMQPTADGGYILAGNTGSFGIAADVYLIRINNDGDTLWTKTFGGNLAESGLYVWQTGDGGYIVSGSTYSFGAGNSDGYLIKTDSNGKLVWSKTYGGIYNEDIVNVQPALDGGYILLGSTASFGTSSTDFDVYLIKTDANGDTAWTKTLGGTGSDHAMCLQQTIDSGYVITGYTNSFGAGQDDIFLMKTNAAGNLLWTKTYGGTDGEAGSFVQQTADGGYIISGKTHSFGAFSNDGDVYLVRTDNAGDTIWTKTFGGAGTDWGHSVKQVPDGGFVIAGETWSFGAGQNDVYLLKTDAAGNLLWSKTYGGSSFDHGRSIRQTPDGGFIMACFSSSFGAGAGDFYLIKTDSAGVSGCNEDNGATITTVPTTQVTSPTSGVFATTTAVTSPASIAGGGCSPGFLCGNIGIQEIENKGACTVYPNPFTSQTTIRSSVNLQGVTLTINNSYAQPVKQLKNISGNHITFDRGNLPCGLYTFLLSNESGIIAVKKLIILD